MFAWVFSMINTTDWVCPGKGESGERASAQPGGADTLSPIQTVQSVSARLGQSVFECTHVGEKPSQAASAPEHRLGFTQDFSLNPSLRQLPPCSGCSQPTGGPQMAEAGAAPPLPPWSVCWAYFKENPPVFLSKSPLGGC